MTHHGDAIPPGKRKLLRKSMEMQLHQIPEPMEKKVNTKHPQKHTQKKNVSIFTKNHILYSCRKTDEDFDCERWNCCPTALPVSQVAHWSMDHFVILTNQIPVINSIKKNESHGTQPGITAYSGPAWPAQSKTPLNYPGFKPLGRSTRKQNKTVK